eukprot:COSAG01_NODE_18331_length_1084_cov_1.146193_1_plen_134_part_00
MTVAANDLGAQGDGDEDEEARVPSRPVSVETPRASSAHDTHEGLHSAGVGLQDTSKDAAQSCRLQAVLSPVPEVRGERVDTLPEPHVDVSGVSRSSSFPPLTTSVFSECKLAIHGLWLLSAHCGAAVDALLCP